MENCYRLPRKAVLDVISSGSVMSGRSRVMPILDTILCRIGNGVLRVSSYDSETFVTYSMPSAELVDELSFCVHPKDLIGILSSVDDDSVNFRIMSDALKVEYSSGEVSFPISDAASFPSPSHSDADAHYDVPSDVLLRWLTSCSRFVATDDVRIAMNGVYLYVKDGEFGCASTDSRSLFHDSCLLDDSMSGFREAILSRKALPSVISLLSSCEEGSNVRLDFRGTHISLTTSDGSSLYSRIVDARYPKFRAIFPSDYGSEFRLDTSSLRSVLKRSMVVCDSRSRIAKFSFRDGSSCHIESVDEEHCKRFHESIPCAYSSSDVSFLVDAGMALNVLSSVSDESVSLYVTSPLSPIFFSDALMPKKKMLLMPMRNS